MVVMDTIELMQTFCRVVDAGSFTRAAEQLNLSRAVVSKYVRTLEARLDSRLLNRTTRSLSLTESGKHYYQRAGNILEQLIELEADVASRQKRVHGLLRVSAPLTYGEMFVAPRLPDLLTEYPDLHVDLALSDRYVSLVDDHFDLAIRIGKLNDSSLIARNLGEVTVKLCASPAYLQSHGLPETMEELNDHQLICDSNATDVDSWFATDPAGERQQVAINSRIRINSARAVREMLLRGEGIARCPSFAVDDCLQRGSLVQLLPDYDLGSSTVHALYPSNRHVPEKVRMFIQFIQEAVS